MSPLEIFLEFGDGDIEVNVIVLVEDPCNEVDEDAIGCVLISSELNLHGPELDPPADFVIDRDL